MLHTILSNLPYISIGILVLVAVLLHKYWLLLAALAIFFIHRRHQKQQQEVILQQEPQVCPLSASETVHLEELRPPTVKPTTHADTIEPTTYVSRQPSVPVTEHDPDQNHPRNDHTEIFDRLQTMDDKKTDLSTEEYRLAIKDLFAQKEVNNKSKMYMVRQEEVPGKDKLE